MINQTPSDLGKFPVPPSGYPIPRGWFGRLVRFINPLILHGDGQYLTVKHTLDGQTITPTPALLQALCSGGAPPAAGGGTTGFPDLTGTTTSISLSNSYDVTENSWLIGRVQSTRSAADRNFYLNVAKTGSTTTPYKIRLLLMAEDLDYEENFICLPIHSGLTISFTTEYIGMSAELKLYSCI